MTSGRVGPAATPIGTTTVSMPLLGQLQRIPPFTGEGHENGETFESGMRMFILRPIFETQRHCSCSVDVRSDYKLLVAAMKCWSVQLTAVQTQLFHNRQQGEVESEKGCVQVTAKDPAPTLKPKPLAKKLPTAETQSESTPPVPTRGDAAGAVGAWTSRWKCYNCGMEGHMAWSCPYPKKKRDEEAKGRKEGTLSALTREEDDIKRRIAELQQQLQEVEMKMAVGGKF